MKKILNKTLIGFLIICTMILFNGKPLTLEAQALDIAAESAILVDANTGDILFAKNADIKLPPASMTKMMTEYLVLEAINQDQISWETTVQISDYAYSIAANTSFSGIGLRQNKDYTVRELYEAMAIISDNAATIALAELVAGSEGEFVKLMNQKGTELGLTDFEFVNSSGLTNASLGDNYPEGTDPDADNLISARSAATLAYHLVNDYPEVLDFSSTIHSELDGEPLENLNWMLPWNNTNFAQYFYEGVDGLKTGYTTEAGYCFTGTAVRDGQRLITVVMRTDSYGSRFMETQKLLNYGFNEFNHTELYPAGYQLENQSLLEVSKGKEKEVEIELADSLSSMVRVGEEEGYSIEYIIDENKLNEDGQLIAPLERGEKVGEARLVYDGNGDYGNIKSDRNGQTVDLITVTEVEQANWFMLTLNAIGDFFANIFTTVVETVKGWF
ncbi:D-alanyl-D-alanine carboxypeptidase family protein [Amphibacillus sediminis]|uniref:D-alanyl-D-alanine carboxypeptidase family protein n=1 Tax=Amphibacillus sediminis TaxID=360185 RepID=UPI00082E6CA0